MNDSWPRYPLEIPDALLKKLVALQSRDAKTDPLCRSETAVKIFSGMGAPAYLTLSGDVFQDNGSKLEPFLCYASEEMVGAYLLVGAWRSKLPQLMDLLPPAPEGTEICPECDGAKPWDAEGGERPAWCRRCGSRGWTYIAPRVKIYEGPPYHPRLLAQQAITKKWWQRLLPRA